MGKEVRIFAALGALVAVAAWLACRSETPIAAPSAPVVSASASASASTTDKLAPLYDRTVHGRVVHITRGHVASASSPIHGALARTRSGQWVSVALLTPIDKLDDVNVLEAPELLSGTAFDGNCEVSLFMYVDVDAAKNARSCAEAFDPSRDLHGHRETLDLVKLGVDPALFADVIDFEEKGVPLRLVRVLGVIDDLCFAMHASMKADVDRRLGLLPTVVKDLSIAIRP